MRPSTIWYTLKQGIKNIKRNWMFSLASIITMAACIFLFGIFFSIVNNVNNIINRLNSRKELDDENVKKYIEWKNDLTKYIKYILLKKYTEEKNRRKNEER